MAARGFRHEALFYADEDSFLAGTLPFIRDGIERGEPVMVTVDSPKIDLLKSRLNGSSERVEFVDVRALGRNPALILPAWQDFIAENAGGGRRLRGIGEPIWPERSPSEVIECHHHESLLNLAFEDGPDWHLLCPYDRSALSPSVLRGAAHTHPLIAERGGGQPSSAYREPEETRAPFVGPLSDPPATNREVTFDSPDDLGAVRRFIAENAARIDDERADGLVLAVDEIATNTLRHGGGTGRLRCWSENGSVVCEVSDAGTITDPLVGRVLPDFSHTSGRGLWIANHFCDLVQIRSSSAGTVVRCRVDAAAPDPA